MTDRYGGYEGRWNRDRDQQRFRWLTAEALRDADAHTTGRVNARAVYRLTPQGRIIW